MNGVPMELENKVEIVPGITMADELLDFQSDHV